MIPYPFAYHRATSLEHAEALLARIPDARLLAGGHTLIPAMKLRLANPSALIDIRRLPELSFIRDSGRCVAVGAMTTHAEVANSELVRTSIPALACIAQEIGDPAVRHMGTLGGSIANNDPAADYPAGVLGLGATVRTNRREIAADSFFTGMFSTALGEGEILSSVEFPIPIRAAYVKFVHPTSRYALVGVLVAQTDNTVRVAVTGAGPCVFRVPEMEVALAKDFTPGAIAYTSVSPDALSSDIHGSAEYRAQLVTVIAKRAVVAALASSK